MFLPTKRRLKLASASVIADAGGWSPKLSVILLLFSITLTRPSKSSEPRLSADQFDIHCSYV